MDKEEARFVLRCFRPDGADAGDHDFAEALRMAASDRELGEWLASERAQDAEFSEALSRIALPEGLRDEILAGLAAEQGGVVEVDANDGMMIGALAQIAPPEGFRGEILAAMEQSAQPSQEAAPSRSWWKLGIPLAAAAGIMMALVLSRPSGDSGNGWVDLSFLQGAAVPISHVESKAISTLRSPSFSLDLKEPDQKVLFKFIRDEGRPCPEGAVPKGLEDIPGIGCRKLMVDGKEGTIICFRKNDSEKVHMVVFRKSDVDCCDLPETTEPQLTTHDGWAVARWQDHYRVFLLLGNGAEVEALGDLF